ncbi:PIF-6 [Macrobrachium rosenbergii nudivirus]|nr:PIF-6 [Macrobrachium rosenbergii nudivirus]
MNVQEYLKGLIDRKLLPITAWSYKYYANKQCYVIKNSIYCQVFWLDFWYNYLAEKFRKQNVVTFINNLDITLPVIITEDFIMLNAPPVIQNIQYFSEPVLKETPFILKNVSINSVFVFFIILFAFIIFVTYFFFKDSAYTMYI